MKFLGNSALYVMNWKNCASGFTGCVCTLHLYGNIHWSKAQTVTCTLDTETQDLAQWFYVMSILH